MVTSTNDWKFLERDSRVTLYDLFISNQISCYGILDNLCTYGWSIMNASYCIGKTYSLNIKQGLPFLMLVPIFTLNSVPYSIPEWRRAHFKVLLQQFCMHNNVTCRWTGVHGNCIYLLLTMININYSSVVKNQKFYKKCQWIAKWV